MTATGEVRVDAFGLTDIGKLRQKNEDQFVLVSLRKSAEVRQSSLTDPGVFDQLRDQKGQLFVVADGVGGGPAGELASKMAVTALVQYLGRIAMCFNELDTEREHEFLQQLEQGVHEAHQRVSGEFGTRRKQGPATTLTMAMLVWPRAYIVHAGDSRAYYLRKGRLLQLTQDQTMGEFMVGAGAWTETQAQRAPTAGSLVSAVGGPEMTPAVGLVDLQPGDVLLLCTDGLTKHVPNQRIAELLAAAPDAKGACRALVDAALADGGSDNITVVVARMEQA